MSPDKQILLVEDDGAITQIWEEMLLKWGYSFDLVHSGIEALERARKIHYQVLLADLALPGLSGRELIHTLHAEQPDLAVIVVTGNGSVETVVDLMKSGVYDYISKPINFVRAQVSLQNCLSELRSRRESDQLRREREALVALNERKERFLAITGHELRTPVGLLKNAVEILSKEIKGGELELLIDIIHRSSDRLVEIVEQMHELSRTRQEGTRISLSRFQLREVCQSVIGELWLVAQSRRQSLNVRIGDQLFLRADRDKLKKVMRELVENAIKFTADEGVINISAEKSQDGLVRVSVSDSGIGIAERHRERIFELFYEADAPEHRGRSPLGSGMGVGLSLVKEIVTAHGGQVEVISDVGKGSQFTIILPQHGLDSLEGNA